MRRVVQVRLVPRMKNRMLSCRELSWLWCFFFVLFVLYSIVQNHEQGCLCLSSYSWSSSIKEELNFNFVCIWNHSIDSQILWKHFFRFWNYPTALIRKTFLPPDKIILLIVIDLTLSPEKPSITYTPYPEKTSNFVGSTNKIKDWIPFKDNFFYSGCRSEIIFYFQNFSFSN